MSNATVVTTLPNGVDKIFLRFAYAANEVNGVTVLVAISCVSLLAVLGLLVMISISAFNTRSSADEHLFVRTHVALYFVSLLLCDLMQAIGSILNARWVHNAAVEVGNFCVLQGVLKQASDVGTALWTLIIAIHTFCLLVLELRLGRFALLATLIGGWSAVGAIVIAGPAALDTTKHGPFFGISGYWCWISPVYSTERVTLDYMIMFISAFFSFVLYLLMYFRLRGNLKMSGRRMQFRMTRNFQDGSAFNQDHALKIAKQMLLYPLAYTLLILPIAVTRISSWMGHDIPFAATIFSAAVFLCSGIINAILFATTRRILPPSSLKIRISKWSISEPKSLDPASVETGNHDPYYPPAKKGFVDLDLTEKEGYGVRPSMSSYDTYETSQGREIIDPMKSSRISQDLGDAYGGFAPDTALDDNVRPLNVSRSTHESQVPQRPVAAMSRKDSVAESFYSFYTSTSAPRDTYIRQSEYEPFPQELASNYRQQLRDNIH